MNNIQGMHCGRTCRVRFPAGSPPEVILKPSSRRSQKPKFLFLDLEDGQTPEWCEAEALTSLGACTMPNISERHSDAGESFLSWILEGDAPAKYSLSPKACAGILRRAERRGKALPPMLREALMTKINETPEAA